MVRAEQVWKSFGKLDVLKGVDLTVYPRETFVLLGPSAAAASRRCCAASTTSSRSTRGRLYVDGDLMGYREHGGKLHEMKLKDVARQRAKIGMVFQRFNLFPHMTAIQNVMAAPDARAAGERKDEAENEAERLLAQVGLADKLDVLPGAALGRPAAARGDRPGPGHAPQAHALRRAHLARSTPSSSARCSTS